MGLELGIAIFLAIIFYLVIMTVVLDTRTTPLQTVWVLGLSAMIIYQSIMVIRELW